MALYDDRSVQPGHMAPYGVLPVPHFGPELVGLIRTGDIYSLSVVYIEGIPVPGPMVPYTLTPRLRHGDLTDIRPASAAAEAITMSAHTGTHIDALCHIGEHRDEQGNPAKEGQVYLYSPDGKPVKASESVNFQGQTHLGIENMPPIITRAVLLDVAGAKGVEVLPDCYTITPEDVQMTIQKQGTVVKKGTAVLIRTGYYQHLRDGNTAYSDAQAGLGAEAGRMLLDQGMMLVGADNMGVESMPPWEHPVHRLLLVRNGVTHLENLYLEELAAKKVYEFVLIVTPLRLKGCTGSWVHPIAIA